MTTTIEEQNGKTVISLNGRLDTAAALLLEKEVKYLYDSEAKDIILECSKMEYISSSGLRIFLSLLKAVKPKGGHVTIKGVSNEVRDVFTVTGFINLFEFIP